VAAGMPRRWRKLTPLPAAGKRNPDLEDLARQAKNHALHMMRITGFSSWG